MQVLSVIGDTCEIAVIPEKITDMAARLGFTLDDVTPNGRSNYGPVLGQAFTSSAGVSYHLRGNPTENSTIVTIAHRDPAEMKESLAVILNDIGGSRLGLYR